MTDEEKIVALKDILSEQIAWYEEHLEKEKTGEIDYSYIYDCLYEQFEQLSRGQFLAIIETLLK